MIRVAAVWFTLASSVALAAPVEADLDGDGVAETRLSIAPCHGHETLDCLIVDRKSGHSEVTLVDRTSFRVAASTDVHLQGPRIVVIGNHTGTPLAEVAVLSAERDATEYHGVLNVVDVDAGRVVGRARSPLGLFNVFVDAANGPDGRLHPFLAPSFGASTHPAPELGTAGEWDYLCSFVPGANDARCGAGFVAIDIGAGRTDDGSKPADYFREVGGYLQDIDGDGWEDVHLIYHGQVRSISLAKKKLLTVVRYNIATDPATINRTEFAAVAHSGRNYGTHSAVRATDGALRSVMVAGGTIDAFGKGSPPAPNTPAEFRDLFCNVTRFLGVIESATPDPRGRRLKWARYFGFDSSTFSLPPDISDPTERIRPLSERRHIGNFMNGCIHRFSDSRVDFDHRAGVAVNVFHATDPQKTCMAEQYQLYFDGWTEGVAVAPNASAKDAKPWSEAKERMWHACKSQNVRSRGNWTFEVYDEGSGGQLAGMTGGYIWGWSVRIVPNSLVYVVEPLKPNGPFDFTWDFARDQASPVAGLLVRELEHGKWTRTWKLPGRARPAFAHQPGRGVHGVADYSYRAEFVTADVDGDGIDEIQLEDGSWVGLAPNGNAFVCKKDCNGAKRDIDSRDTAPSMDR